MSRLSRVFSSPPTALSLIGGAWPVPTEEFALRAYLHALNPLRNPLKEAMDASDSVRSTPPSLGIFSDIPWHQLRESEVHSWARAGFTWVVCDGEHSQSEGTYGREQLAMLLRHGITPVQRLAREARSAHGDSLTMGARGTMAPYGTTAQEVHDYFKCINYPDGTASNATPLDRGGFPMRRGDRSLLFTPESLKAAETETQGWVQFETSEYISDVARRDAVLDHMAVQGHAKAVGFIGPFDLVMRGGASRSTATEIANLIDAAADRNVHMGRVCGSGTQSSPQEIEDAMVAAIEAGSRLIAVHYLTSDLPFLGAKTAATPFFRAATRCGF